jgi:hypothetical protein
MKYHNFHLKKEIIFGMCEQLYFDKLDDKQICQKYFGHCHIFHLSFRVKVSSSLKIFKLTYNGKRLHTVKFQRQLQVIQWALLIVITDNVTRISILILLSLLGSFREFEKLESRLFQCKGYFCQCYCKQICFSPKWSHWMVPTVLRLNF